MNKEKHIVIFSHGFGVRKEARGLFTDIAKALPKTRTVMFDYNKVNKYKNTITVKPFSKQVKLLKKVIKEQRKNNPTATIDLICHSQGSRIAAILKPSNIRKIILIAPSVSIGFQKTIDRYKNNSKTKIDLNGITKLPRTDGSTTIVPANFWKEKQNETSPIDLYNKLSKVTEVIIIKPNQDNVSRKTSFKGINKKIRVIKLDGDHDFTKSRKKLCKIIKDVIIY